LSITTSAVDGHTKCHDCKFSEISGFDVKKFSDFAEEDGPLGGGKVRLDSILNVEITITGYRIQASKYSGKNRSGKCLTVQFEMDSEIKVFFTGSDVLIGQLEKYGHEVPFVATVKKVDRYYTLS